MFLRPIAILVLLNVYCSASPILSVGQHKRSAAIIDAIGHQSHIKEPIDSKIDNELLPLQNLHQYEMMRILCEYYEHCNDDDADAQPTPTEDDPKDKRLSSNLFHGIPKFGKRAFSSAFSGIPKFG